MSLRDGVLRDFQAFAHDALEAYLTEVSLTRLGFDVAEVIEALLLCKGAALPVIWGGYPAGSAEARQAIARLDDCLRHLISMRNCLVCQDSARFTRISARQSG